MHPSFVYLLVSHTDTRLSRIIKRVLRSEYSHVGILVGYDTPYPYTVDAYPQSRIVNKHHWYYHGRAAGFRSHQVLQVPVLNPAAGQRWLDQQIGKTYDHRSILGYLLNWTGLTDHLHLRRKDSWSCWPLAYGYLMACWQAGPHITHRGIPEVKLPDHVITPEHLYAAIKRCKESKGVNPFHPDFHALNNQR